MNNLSNRWTNISGTDIRRLVDWNLAATDYPRDKCIHQLFEEQVERTPEAVAVAYNGNQLTYRQLNARANRLARRLLELGVGPEKLVGLCVERSLEMVVGLLGILKAGGAYLPLDPTYSWERVAFVLDDSRAPLVLTQLRWLDSLPTPRARVVSLDEMHAAVERESAENLHHYATGENLAYVIYTSGSTGAPKGVQVPHRAVVNFLHSMSVEPGLGEMDVLLAVTTLSFDISVLELFLPLTVGARVVIVTREVATDGTRLSAELESSGATVMQATPATWRLLKESGWRGSPYLKILCGGEALTSDLADQLLQMGKSVWNLYGPTETTVWSTAYRVESRGTAIPIGRPLANTEVYVLDGERQPVRIGAPGELYIGGAGLARGYLNRPELTAQKFVPHPFSSDPGARLYRTGDLARWRADGNLEFLGRLDQQVKLRGFRIELGEIEAALTEHPLVAQSVVLLREDRPGEKQLVAYVVSRQAGTSPGAPELRKALRRALPDYMVPAAFVTLDALPLTPNGKVDRKALPVPAADYSVASETFIAPRTPIEGLLAGVWCDVLGMEQVGIHDDFFELGGHSLRAARVVAQVRDAFTVDLPVRTLFEAPTVASLAERVETARSGPSVATLRLVPLPRNGKLPLSFAQQRLWFLDQLEPGSGLYNIPSVVSMCGPLDPAALEQSLEEIIRRHEALRTTFRSDESQPMQVIESKLELHLPLADLRELPERERASEARRLAEEEANRPFDLSKDLMLRARLIRLAEDEHLFVLTLHHIAADGWSMGIFWRELAALYQAFSEGHPSPLPELPVQYADYAIWQREWLQGEVLDKQLAYWKERLAGAPTVLDLPTDFPRPIVQSNRGARQDLVLGQKLTQRLQKLSRQEGVTLFMTLLAAWQVLLSRYSGQEDVVVGSPIAGRSRTELEGLIGFFVNTLALRTDLSGDPTFRDLLGRVREVTLEAYAHQDLPFEKLIEELRPERNLSHSPFLQVMLVLQNTPQKARELKGLSISPYAITNLTSKFDLTLSLTEQADGLQGTLEYNTDLFEAATIARLLGHFQVLLHGIVADPQQRIGQLPLLTDAERQQVLVDWNQTATDYPRDKCVHQLFEEQVERTPDAVALQYSGRTLTYQQLNRQANQLARHLQEFGVGPEVRVGVCVERSPAMVIGSLAILKAGGAYVPLDLAYPRGRVALMLQESQASVLLTQQGLAETLPAHAAKVVCLDADWPRIGVRPDGNLAPSAGPTNLAYVIYTSGSTGRPKGVAIEHHSTVNLIGWALGVFTAEELSGVLASTSICFDLSVYELFLPLSAGGRVVLVENALAIQSLAPEAGIKLINTVPSAIAELLRLKAIPDSVVTVNLAGELLSTQLVNAIYRQTRSKRVYDLYGPSESTTYSTCSLRWPGIPATIGRPIANTQVYVLDKRRQPVPVGVPGELYIAGDGLARGYLNQPELTAERFVADPFSNRKGARLYGTGDLVRWRPDGNLEFLGRLDHQVKLRGFRIELGEIEAVLTEHPRVAQSVVLLREDNPDDKRLVAYVVPRQAGATLTSVELRHFLHGKLPEYMVPSAFAVLRSLPLTPNGKVDRKALPEPEVDRLEAADTCAAPCTPIEELLAGIWCEVLGVKRVGIHDNFFELGGHSLLATRVVARVRDSLSIDVPVRSLFEAPTVAALAGRIETECLVTAQFASRPIQPAARDGNLPLSFAQERLWFFDELEPGSAVYNLPWGLRLCGPLNVPALERSLKESVRRHEALRTVIANVNGQPQPAVLDGEQFRLVKTDLRHLPAGERESTAGRLVAEDAARSFDLSHDLMLRGQLVRLGEEEHWLLLTMHHIASDGWSLGVFGQELAALYAAFSAGRPSPLPDLRLQYADFAVWQRQWLQGDVLDRQLSYWREQLAGPPAVLELPTDYPPSAVPSYRGASHEILLDEQLTEAIHELSRQEGVTPFMTLLAAFQLLLSRYSGQEDVSVGAPIAGRHRTEWEGLIGFFVNTLVLRTDLSGNPTFRELLGRIRKVTLGAYAHQDLPFEKLVMEINPPRVPGRHPLCDVLLNYLDVPQNRPDLGRVECHALPLQDHPSKFQLTLYVVPERALRLRFVYRKDLFSDERMRLFGEQFAQLVHQAVADPDHQVGSFSLVTPNYHRLLPDPTRELGAPVYPPVTQLLRDWAERTPEQFAIWQGASRWTYAEIRKLSENAARHLLARGVRQGDLVAVYGRRSVGTIVGMLGVLKCGTVLVLIDADLPAWRRELMLHESGPRAIVCTNSDDWIAAWNQNLPDVVRLNVDPSSGEISGDDASCELPAETLPQLSPDDPAYIFFTSGTTGIPKGVVGVHKGLSHFLEWQRAEFAIGPNDRVAQLTALSFDVVMREMFLALTSGGTICLPDTADLPDPAQLFQWLEHRQISVLHTVRSLVEFWLDQLPGNVMLPSLRFVFFVGEPLPDTLVERLRRVVSPNCTIVNLYGTAETGPAKCSYRVPAEPLPGIQPIGRPLPHAQALVVAHRARQCGVGEIGEIAVRSPFLAKGYLKSTTESGFAPNPFRDDFADRLYFTGDRGRYRLDGTLEILGRSDDQVKIRGIRVEPGEIEELLRRHPSVQTCVVVPIVRQEGTWLAAYVVPRPHADISPALLRSFLTVHLVVAMIPSAFVILDALPIGPNGKVDRKALPITEFSRSEPVQTHVAPRTPVERQLTLIWTEILKLEQVGIHDNFFELGGHSLLATQVVSRIRRDFSVEVPLLTIFETPTIETLALFLLQHQAQAIAADGMEELLAELESISDERAEQQLLLIDTPCISATITDSEETPPPLAPAFHCPGTSSEWFGKRKCNLVIVLNEHLETDSFERIARRVGELDPSIDAVVVRDQPSVSVSLATRPTLIFSPALIRHRPPIPGRVFCGCPLSKSEEYRALAKAGIPVPKWVLLTEDHTPDLSGFHDYVVRKPDYGGLGAEVKLVRKQHVRWKMMTTRAMGPSAAMIVQRFVYTGRRPVNYRVNTLFGRVLYSVKHEANSDLPELENPEDIQSPFRPKGGVSIVASARGSRVEFNYDEEVIRFAESAHAAFPEIPLLGFDIVREVSSGKLFVMEANALGWVWHFGSRQTEEYGFSFEEQFDGVRKAAWILAEKTQQTAR